MAVSSAEAAAVASSAEAAAVASSAEAAAVAASWVAVAAAGKAEKPLSPYDCAPLASPLRDGGVAPRVALVCARLLHRDTSLTL